MREDSSFHCRPGRGLPVEGVMSQKQAEGEERRAGEAQGQAATFLPRPRPPSPHHPITHTLHSVPLLPERRQPSLTPTAKSPAPSRIPWIFFFFSQPHLTLIPPLPSVCLAVCSSPRHPSNLISALVCSCMDASTGLRASSSSHSTSCCFPTLIVSSLHTRVCCE